MDSRNSRWPLARIAVALVAIVAVAAVLLGCGSTRAHAQTSNVSAATVGNPIPAGFVGLSIEMKALEQYAGQNPAAINPVLLHLLADISPDQSPVLRVGGDSTDWSWWPVPHMAQPPGVKFTLTPTWMGVARAVAADLHARLILGIDLEADNRALATAEAQAMVQRIGRNYIDALELGNEPELYGSFGWYRSRVTGLLVPGRPRGYDVSDFISDWSSLAPALPDVPLAGPSSGGPEWLAGLGSFLRNEPRVRLVTIHAYPLKHCTKATVVTIPELLANSSSAGLAQRVAPFLADADRHRAPLRIDELNGVSCGGTRGVSDTFASALWVLDTLFEMAKLGVSGVNIHSVPGTINEILGPQQTGSTWSMRVHPEYYGMIMFAQAAPAGSRLLRLSLTPPANVKVWATRATNGTIHIVVINKRLAQAATVRLRVAGAHGAAAVEQLRAPRVNATTGVTLGGQTFGAATTTGVLAGPAAQASLSPTGGAYAVSVAPASATMLTLPAS